MFSTCDVAESAGDSDTTTKKHVTFSSTVKGGDQEGKVRIRGKWYGKVKLSRMVTEKRAGLYRHCNHPDDDDGLSNRRLRRLKRRSLDEVEEPRMQFDEHCNSYCSCYCDDSALPTV